MNVTGDQGNKSGTNMGNEIQIDLGEFKESPLSRYEKFSNVTLYLHKKENLRKGSNLLVNY